MEFETQQGRRTDEKGTGNQSNKMSVTGET